MRMVMWESHVCKRGQEGGSDLLISLPEPRDDGADQRDSTECEVWCLCETAIPPSRR